eukprot:8006328-Lingulodinium_polyedra.AAC.1
MPPTSPFVAINLHPEERRVASNAFAMNESILLDHPQHGFISEALMVVCGRLKDGPIFRTTAGHLAE